MYSFDLIYVQAWSRPYIRSFDLIYVQVDLTIYLKTDFCPIWRVIVVLTSPSTIQAIMLSVNCSEIGDTLLSNSIGLASNSLYLIGSQSYRLLHDHRTLDFGSLTG